MELADRARASMALYGDIAVDELDEVSLYHVVGVGWSWEDS